MLEPSSDTPMNMESCSYYTNNSQLFDNYVQKALLNSNSHNQQIRCNNCSRINDNMRLTTHKNPSNKTLVLNEPTKLIDENTNDMIISSPNELISQENIQKNNTSSKRKLSNRDDSDDLNDENERYDDNYNYRNQLNFNDSNINNIENTNINNNNNMNNSLIDNNIDNNMVQSFKRMKYDENYQTINNNSNKNR